MVKKTLLSLAIAATTLTLAGCNLSTTDKYENEIVNQPVGAGNASMPEENEFYPKFSPMNGDVPLAIDLVFGINSSAAIPAGGPGKDGTANTADTTPPVTTAMNKLDGFSTNSPIFIEFNKSIKESTVDLQSVVVVRFLSAADEIAAGRLPTIDALDAETMKTAATAMNLDSPIVGGVAQGEVPMYDVNVVSVNGGTDNALQILFHKPLAPKTKYFVMVTDDVTDVDGNKAKRSQEYDLVYGDYVLPSASLAPLRPTLRTWTETGAAVLASAAGNAVTPAQVINKVALAYTFTTGGTTDVLHAMAAPGLFIENNVRKAIAEGVVDGSDGALTDVNSVPVSYAVSAAEAKMTESLGNAATATFNGIAAKVAAVAAPGANITTAAGLKAHAQASSLLPHYYSALVRQMAKSQASGVTTAIDAPKVRDYEILSYSLDYDDFLEPQVEDKVEALVGESVPTAEALLGATNYNAIARGIASVAAPSAGITDAASLKAYGNGALIPTYLATMKEKIVESQFNSLTSKGSIHQAAIKLPSYLPNSQAGAEDGELGSWSGSDAAAKALGLAQAPRDLNGSINVSYRFPFAEKQGDNVIPMLITLPKAGTDADTECIKPGTGWPVAIYQHGITVDRTAGLLVGNALAKYPSCTAMVAIDHVMHGVAPRNNDTTLNSLRLFNIEKVAADPTKSPFAYAAQQTASANGSSLFASIQERHFNVAKNAAQKNIPMVFDHATSAIGASGDLYINLNNFARTRDAMRQTILDMLNVNATIPSIDVDGDEIADFDKDKVYFVGHSLGAILGATFVAVNNDAGVQVSNGNLPKLKAVALGNGGAGVVKLLENSPSIGSAKILPGLQAAAGLEQGMIALEKFFGVFQATLDSVDPINFAAGIKGVPVLAYTVLEDDVVPNNTLSPTAPTAKSYLSGTKALMDVMSATPILDGDSAFPAINTSTGANNVAEVRFKKTYTPAQVPGAPASSPVTNTHKTFSLADPQATFVEIFKQFGHIKAYGSFTGLTVSESAALENE